MSSSGKMADIKISDIRLNPVSLRPVDKNSDKYKELVASVRQVGLLNAISVVPVDNPDPAGPQMYAVIDGAHRFTAACDAQLETIPVLIRNLDEAQVEEAQIIANIHRIETTPAQYTKQLQRLLFRNPDLTISELANRLGKSSTWLNERLSLADLPEKMQKLIDEGVIKLSNGVTLAKLPPELVNEHLEAAQTMNTAEFAQRVNAAVKQHRDALRTGRDPNAVKTFVPTISFQKMAFLKEVLQDPKTIGNELLAKVAPATLLDAFTLGIQFTLKSDPLSVEQQRLKWEAAQKAAADKKEAAKKERDAKKAATPAA